jgi:hypothetical protein
MPTRTAPVDTHVKEAQLVQATYAVRQLLDTVLRH